MWAWQSIGAELCASAAKGGPAAAARRPAVTARRVGLARSFAKSFAIDACPRVFNSAIVVEPRRERNRQLQPEPAWLPLADRASHMVANRRRGFRRGVAQSGSASALGAAVPVRSPHSPTGT